MKLVLRPLTLLAALALIASIAAAAFFFLNPKRAAAFAVSPLLVNQTADHRYDRSLRESIRFFEGRTEIQLGIILQDSLPAQKSIEEFAAESFKQIRLGEKYPGKALLYGRKKSGSLKSKFRMISKVFLPMRCAVVLSWARVLFCFQIRLMHGAIF
jgi:hypothetical protein